MGWFRKKKQPEKRDLTVPPALAAFFGGGGSYDLNADSAMRLYAVNACVRVLRESISILPLHIFKETPSGKERAKDLPLAKLLSRTPNRYQTPFEFFEFMVESLLLRGNSYVQVLRSRAGEILELIPLHPDRVTPNLSSAGVATYKVSMPNGESQVFTGDQIWHIRNASNDGFIGRSVISERVESLGHSQVTGDFVRAAFENGGRPDLVLKYPEVLDEETQKRIRESWDAHYKGPKNAGKTAVLESGLDIKEIAVSNEDKQLIETRKINAVEICGLFRVPPHMIGLLDRATFSNIEHQSIEFVTFTLSPWLSRIEQSANRYLFQKEESSSYYTEFLVEKLLRGDTLSRYSAYRTALEIGLMSPDEMRAKENMNPLPNGIGAGHYVPLNLQRLGEEKPADVPANVPSNLNDQQSNGDQDNVN